MNGLRQGSFRLFGVAGIDVFVHWSWLLVAAYEINARAGSYSSIVWNVLEYLALFAIVTTHEFGHALACRQVGGVANQIVLWPLGGVAYVDPPQRPGAVLWSIVAGPLVNVVLIPVLFGLYVAFPVSVSPDLHAFLLAVNWTNLVLLLFNVLPIYPLDGGKILWALLWFGLGRARSLYVAVVIGFIGMAAFLGYAYLQKSTWLGILAVFMLLNCWSGLQQARALLRLAKMPRREGFACPSCKAEPPTGELWTCGLCKKPFDIFQSQGICPNCSARFSGTRCIDCGRSNSIADWTRPVVVRPLG